MREGVFLPQIYSPPPAGPGTGCQLSIADMVTVGLLHELFSLGVRFERLRMSGKSRDGTTEIVLLDREIPGAPKVDFTGNRRAPETWIDTSRVMDIGKSRAIQLFLEEFDSDVHLTFRKISVRVPKRPGQELSVEDDKPSRRVRTYIRLFPSTPDLIDHHTQVINGAQTYYEAVVFINARYFREQVKRALGA